MRTWDNSSRNSDGFHRDFDMINDTSSNESPSELIQELMLKNTQQHDIAIIVVGAFSIAAAVFVIVSILYDAFLSDRRHRYDWKSRLQRFFPKIHPAEVFPLIMAFAIIIQCSIFVAIQSGGMNGIQATGCRRTAELLWPAIWIVALTALVFGMETVFRSLRRHRFRPRGKLDIGICFVVIVIMLVLLWIPSLLLPTNDQCTASLVRWTEDYARIGVVLCASIIFTHFVSAWVIITQLLRTIKMDRNERIAATRVVYSLGTNTIILALVIPYYTKVLLFGRVNTTANLANIALVLSGLLHAAVHIFLRANSERMAIRPREAPWTENRGIRILGPSDLNMSGHIFSPLLRSDSMTDTHVVFNNEDGMSPTRSTKNPRNLRIQDIFPAASAPLTSQSEPPSRPTQSAQRHHQSKASYSFYPTHASERRISLSTNGSSKDDEVTMLPPALFTPRHTRDESESATVRIGMRISEAHPSSVTNSEALRLPSRAFDGKSVSRQTSLARPPPSEESLVLPKRFRTPQPSTIEGSDEDGDAVAKRDHKLLQMNKSLPPVPRIPSELFLPVSKHHPVLEPAWTSPPRTVRQTDSWF